MSASAEDHFVEIVETATGKVEKCMGPMSEGKAAACERGIMRNLDAERFFVRSGTRAALDAEVLAREAPDPSAPAPVLAHAFAHNLGLRSAPGWEAELEDGQGLAVLAVAAHDAAAGQPIGPERAARLHEELSPAAAAAARRSAHEEIVENAAADVLAAALELAAAPRSAPRQRALRSAALKYGTLRGVRPRAPKKGAAHARRR